MPSTAVAAISGEGCTDSTKSWGGDDQPHHRQPVVGPVAGVAPGANLEHLRHRADAMRATLHARHCAHGFKECLIADRQSRVGGEVVTQRPQHVEHRAGAGSEAIPRQRSRPVLVQVGGGSGEHDPARQHQLGVGDLHQPEGDLAELPTGVMVQDVVNRVPLQPEPVLVGEGGLGCVRQLTQGRDRRVEMGQGLRRVGAHPLIDRLTPHSTGRLQPG
ncbi:MAG: hypothetical protein QM804_14740 [Propionicimonas sp.]